MKFCANHWDEMRDALAARGLDQFIAPSGEEAARRMQEMTESLDGVVRRDIFEPLMGMQIAMVANASDAVGLETLQEQDASSMEWCLLCYLIDNCECGLKESGGCGYQSWIEYAANDMIDVAKDLGLVGSS